jgi:hypothetical protein
MPHRSTGSKIHYNGFVPHKGKIVSYSTSLRQTVDVLEALPAMPKIAQEILSLPMANDDSNEVLLKLIEKDPCNLGPNCRAVQLTLVWHIKKNHEHP